MVGKRHAHSFTNRSSSHSQSNHDKDDVESGRSSSRTNNHSNTNGDCRPRPDLFRYRDHPSSNNTSTAKDKDGNYSRQNLQDTLLKGIDRDYLEKFRKSPSDLEVLKKKKGLKAFYEEQNRRLNDWLEVDTIVMAIADDVLESMDPDPDNDGDRENMGGLQHMQGAIASFLPDDVKEKRQKDEKKAKWAININVLANIILLAAKCTAVFYSSSLSLIASTVDSALDLLCVLIVWTTNRLVSWRLTALHKRFPVGRRRLEPLGILVFSILMVISFMQILKESVEKLLPSSGEEKKPAELPPLAIAAMLGTIIIKGIIWIGCARIKTTQVQALAQDCKTDVYFNSLSLIFPLIGIKTGTWWLDPVGAAVLSLFIIYDWAGTGFENITRLSGQAADRSLEKKLLFMAYRFSDVVEGFKSVKAYHAGDHVWVEYEILLKPDTPLRQSHDVVSALQYCCEGLEDVDRAFVSVDYTSQGPTGHAEDAERN